MPQGKKFKTDQEEFWAGEFGDHYTERNTGAAFIPPQISMFSSVLRQTRGVKEVIELGANVGINLLALKQLLPEGKFKAVEINKTALRQLRSHGWIDVHEGSLLEADFVNVADLSFTAGVLIHINPDELKRAYAALYKASRKYVCVCEYYNPSPVAVPYRNHEGKLFKRDFAGEMLDIYKDLRLVDYGFVYRRDPNFPLDDITWFLMEKSTSKE